MKEIDSIQKIKNSFSDSKDTLIAQFKTWDPIKDARITVFSKCINVCNSTQLSFTFMHFHLINLDWWKEIAKSEIPANDAQIYANEYAMFTKIGFIQFTFSSIESAFRIYVKSLDPNACNNGTAEFKSIYSWLLKRVNLQNHENLLDLFRLIRNTIHNNGVYFHKSGISESITYKAKVYNFNIGQPVDFVTWDFIFEVMEEVEELIVNVIKTQEISSVIEIIDPFAK
ncbi:hypothetical protein C8C85_0359 [Flavobacterium sp. 103]|uniref:hypothetical protein n=1 Tax=Flavobacterium sp. 103 TaxID=2135624 RepID=UPI000D5F8FBB|nr:hypothetical protein [Flavobacterium sp. 103]PVX44614.1 hypothetical protein C8C85_0359 [Flavobacterium sp. 103]